MQKVTKSDNVRIHIPPNFYGHPGCDKIARPPPNAYAQSRELKAQNAQNSTEVRPIELIPAWGTRRREIDHALSKYAIETQNASLVISRIFHILRVFQCLLAMHPFSKVKMS